MLNKLLTATTLHQLNWTWPTISPAALTLFILVSAFGILSTLERHVPKAKQPRKQLRQSYQTNFSLFLFNSVVMSLLSATSLLMIARYPLFEGLLSGISDSVGKIILSLLSLDLLLYGWHRACHHFDGFWLFHKVHHNDPYLNVSTGFRLHIVELLITHLLKALLIIVMGIDELIVLISEVASTLFVMLHHTNISFKVEKWLGLVFITPYLHRTHHSVQRNEHDSNYGAILSIWDRVFGSIKELEPAKIGIKGNSPQDFVNLLKFGFTVHVPPATPESDLVNLDAMIAEAAYYKAEKRNFAHGQDLNDWLEAKKEIIRMVYENSKAQPQTRTVNKILRSYFDWLHFPMHLNFRHG
jgi:sterol desaturase/sphingolipid hydroxylase (fatty acid hydroxylase superfamily)